MKVGDVDLSLKDGNILRDIMHVRGGWSVVVFSRVIGFGLLVG